MKLVQTLAFGLFFVVLVSSAAAASRETYQVYFLKIQTKLMPIS